MKLPSVEEALALFQEYRVPGNILEHCKKVSELATRIAQKLSASGIPVDSYLVRIGALLHDWMKAVTLEKLEATKKFGYAPTQEEIAMWEKLRSRFKGKHEGEIAAELLRDKYPELASFLLKKDLISKDPFKHRDWEMKIIHYADWRVLGAKVIPLSERMDDLFKRYNKIIMKSGLDRWERVKDVEFEHEKEICETAGVKPEEIHG